MPINYQGSGGGVPRKTAKIFGKNAASNDMTVFGSTLGGNTVYSSDLDSIQSAAYETGWRDAVISNLNYPLLSDMNAIQHTLSQQIAYTLQHGIPEYDSGTIYYAYDKVQWNDIIYTALQDNFSNINPSNTSYWAVYYNPSAYANVDLSNLTYNGETHFLNKTQISNCILKAPNGVMTYTSTSLTVKGGLTVLIPSGINGDGSLRNIEYTLPADQTTPYIPYASTVQDRRHAIFLDTNGAITLDWAKGAYTIGAVAPTTFYAGSAIWYDTMNNVIKETNDNGATWTAKLYVFLGDLDVNLFSSTINLVKSNLPIRLFSKNADNEIAQLSFPSTTKEAITVGATGSYYTAFGTGFFYATGYGNVHLANTTRKIESSSNYYEGVWGGHAFVPVQKGDVVSLSYVVLSGAVDFFFVYAEGEVY